MKSARLILFVLVLVSLVLASCATPEPVIETVVVTQVVEKEGETVIETQIVEVTKEVEVKVEVPVEAEKPQGKVTIWYDSGAAWNEFIAQFNSVMAAQYPDIEIEWATQDAAQLSAKLVAAFAAEEGPDIAMGSQYRLVGAEQQFEAWEDMSDELASDPELQEIVAALPEVHVDSYYSGEKLWGLPQVVQSVGLFVRKSWLENLGAEPPKDWTELTALAERFTNEDPDGNGKDDTFGYCIFGAPGVTNSAGTQFLYSGAAAGMEYPIIDLEGSPVFNSDKGVEVAQWMYKWMHESKVLPPDTPTFTHKEYYTMVQAGKCGMGRVGAWNIGSWASSEIGEDFVVIEYPPINQGDANYQVSWSNAIAMNDNPENADATYVVFKALMSKWGQTAFYTKLTSAARTDLDWDKLAKTEQLKYFTEPRDFVLELTPLENWLPVLDVLSGHLNAMLADPSITPEDALAGAEQDLP